MPRPAVGILTRAPAPGRTKTRLARTIGAAAAVSLATAMLQDAVEAVRAGPWRTVVFVEPGAEVDAVRSLASHADALPQGEGDIGARMRAAAMALFGAGRGPVVLVGTDIPSLGAAQVEAALDALAAGPDVVFGPAADGGYYLLGLRRLRDDREGALFSAAIPWGGPDVLARSEAAAASAGLRAARIEMLRDIDTAADLEDLRLRIGEAGVAGPRTTAVVRSLGPGR
ncbi:MAG: TIGR04282 family arsenosugar biosynthesis glycosyltransferase [Gemmatimonadota bacterium]|nr:TIGR04282 family arsenosugar biosynthesis glycosyltransferase [Gemmatimonadota bacterium]